LWPGRRTCFGGFAVFVSCNGLCCLGHHAQRWQETVVRAYPALIARPPRIAHRHHDHDRDHDHVEHHDHDMRSDHKKH
jgi:hypothetical protein